MLTAAHCAQTSGIEVILGDHDYDQTGETILGEKRFSVARAIVHEDYMYYGIISKYFHFTRCEDED